MPKVVIIDSLSVKTTFVGWEEGGQYAGEKTIGRKPHKKCEHIGFIDNINVQSGEMQNGMGPN